MKNKKWGILSDDGRIEFDLMTMRQDDKGVTSTGLLLFDGKEQGTLRITTPDLFTTQRKPKKPPRMVAYALAYYLALRVKEGASNAARELVSEWMGNVDHGDIRKAVRSHKPQKNAVMMAVTEPFGVIVMHDPSKIRICDNKLFYNGLVWAWKLGDKEALIGVSSLKDIESPLLIDSPLSLLKK